MKKKIFAVLMTLILILSMFVSVPVIADESTTEVGGLDFYSITLHYENPILVSYYQTKIEKVNEQGKTEKVAVKYFYNTDAESEEGKFIDAKNNSMTSDKLVIPAGTKTIGNFNQFTVSDKKGEMFYSKIPYNNAFLTHILDKSGICTSGKVDFFGITDPYDDAPYVNKNPNLKYSDDGYALAAEVDDNGNNLKIDVNGYVFDSNYIWKTDNGERVELFYQVPVIKKTGLKYTTGKYKDKPITAIEFSNEYVWIEYNKRFDENNKMIDISTMKYDFMVTDDEFQAFLLDDSVNTLKMYCAPDEATLDLKPKKISAKEVGYQKVYPQPYLVSKEKEPNTYLNKDRVFTAEDIALDANGNPSFATPTIGTPIINAKIKDITVEIDALGDKLYDDSASDPQQKNTITVSINDCKYNAELIKQWFNEGLYTQEEYDDLTKFVLGSAKSQTTRTEINMTKGDYVDGYSPTFKSISLGVSPEILAKIPLDAIIFVEFDINQHQPEAAWNEDYQKKMINKNSEVFTENISLLTDADKPVKKTTNTAQDAGFPTWAIIAIAIGGGVLLITAAVVVILVVKKKKKS